MIKNPTCPFGTEVTSAQHTARADWEREMAYQLETEKPASWEILQAAHLRTARVYDSAARKLERPVPGAKAHARHVEHCYECDRETEHMNEPTYMGCVPCRITNLSLDTWLKLWSIENLVSK